MAQDSSRPDFWETRYRQNVTPWDQGGVPRALADFVAAHRRRERVLVPGCGSAWEVRLFHDAGWDVMAIDFSEAALETARRTLGGLAHLACFADFFQFGPGEPFDLIYERAFLCALPRSRWPDYAARSAQLLRPGGLLAGFFFFHDAQRGPPFGTGDAELTALLSPAFDRLVDRPVDDSIAIFAGKERWQVWRRR